MQWLRAADTTVSAQQESKASAERRLRELGDAWDTGGAAGVGGVVFKISDCESFLQQLANDEQKGEACKFVQDQ
eukprot:8464728-Pyramimonas_sp.AAC.1